MIVCGQRSHMHTHNVAEEVRERHRAHHRIRDVPGRSLRLFCHMRRCILRSASIGAGTRSGSPLRSRRYMLASPENTQVPCSTTVTH